ncbi:MAG: HAD-IC family P-type ATPase [Xanthomonadales bacterium]|nr:HAD-IC family P-type ATPase [Xanthomonadales bacterium]
MMLSEALFLGADGSMPAATRDLFRWLTFLLTTPVVLYAGWPFLAGMAAELRRRAPGMDSLVAGGTLAAWLGSTVETLRGGPHVWYDAAAMFVLFLLAARELEAAQRRRARAAVEALGGREVALALREQGDGRLEALPPSALRPGDRVLVRAGEALPADGILEQDAELDEALLTGESRPVHRSAGSLALAGSIALGASLRLRVHRVGAQCLRAQLGRLAERAQLERPPLMERAEAVALRFTAAVFLIALAAAAFWLAHEPGRAFEVLLAVLVVSCPCALTLALPSALAAAHAALARRGVLSLRAGALARLARADWALLDKTGTLTRGTPRLAAVRPLAAISAEEALGLAAALARESAHPYAAVFPRDPGPRAEAPRFLPGRGLEGRIGGRRYRLGHGEFVGGAGPLALAREIEAGGRFEPLAVFELDDPPRADAEEALAALRAQGLGIELASGDAPDAVGRLAARLGIRRWRASCTPEDKLALLTCPPGRGPAGPRRGRRRQRRAAARRGRGVDGLRPRLGPRAPGGRPRRRGRPSAADPRGDRPRAARAAGAAPEPGDGPSATTCSPCRSPRPGRSRPGWPRWEWRCPRSW